jgi:hypothetical protein
MYGCVVVRAGGLAVADAAASRIVSYRACVPVAAAYAVIQRRSAAGLRRSCPAYGTSRSTMRSR